MNFNWPIIGDKIFGTLKGSGYKLQMFDKTGKKTLDPHEASRFFATLPSDDPELKEFSILVSVHDENKDSHMDIKTPNLENERDFDRLVKLNRSLQKNVGDREGLSVNWYKFDHVIQPKDDAYNNITESKDISKPFGSTKSSFQKVGNSKLIIRHTDPVDENKQGSRWRHVKAIFIETHKGERFLYPHQHVAGARAMARHLSNDGAMHDEIGEAIKQLSSDYMDLKRCGKMLRHAGDESKTTLLGEALQEINKQVKRLCGPRGYAATTPTLTERTEADHETVAALHSELIERCGCEMDDEEGKRRLLVAARYLSECGCNASQPIMFITRPDITSRAHEFPDQKERLAWQVDQMAECVADDVTRSELVDISDILKTGGVIDPDNINLIRRVFKASQDDASYQPVPGLDRIRELGGV